MKNWVLQTALSIGKMEIFTDRARPCNHGQSTLAYNCTIYRLTGKIEPDNLMQVNEIISHLYACRRPTPTKAESRVLHFNTLR